MKQETRTYLESLVGQNECNNLGEVINRLKAELIFQHKVDKKNVVNLNAQEVLDLLETFKPKVVEALPEELPMIPDVRPEDPVFPDNSFKEEQGN